jgi:hypothetical protein
MSTDFLELKWTGNSPLSGHKIMPVNLYASHLNPDHTFLSFLKNPVIIILPSTHRSPKLFLSFRFSDVL